MCIVLCCALGRDRIRIGGDVTKSYSIVSVAVSLGLPLYIVEVGCPCGVP